jgi:hypothetical protein
MTRNQLVALLILLLLAILAAIGCVVYRAQVARVLGASGFGRVNAGMTQHPIDFSLRYEWHAGTMPPPYHHEYIIEIGPGPQGQITFYPDYPGEGVPEWRETFAVTEEDLDRLYGSMVDAGVLRRRWATMRDRPVGGDVEWLDVTADGEAARIPVLPEGGEALEPMYGTIRGLVPDEIWERLRARRQEYEDNYRD